MAVLYQKPVENGKKSWIFSFFYEKIKIAVMTAYITVKI